MDTHGLTANGPDDILWRCTKELRDNGELVDMILPGEQGSPFQHLGKYTASTPDVHLDIILLPREHNLGGAVVSCRHVTGHLRILDTSEAKVTDLQVAVLVDQDVAGFEVAMHHTSRVYIF